ncbi:uncharacterized protein TNIN_417881 [Trichonephila inaurata madagascariensis]|uniref:Uncharacterized protein n=1 Tax=Trichonephila inaurata madagascariensis TaxID=2747483 RepID=A0A8X6XNS3_9ARAC|nr:uncharacterized protein TNIN_417881 [Trichonephila inaurata madagascariensis]
MRRRLMYLKKASRILVVLLCLGGYSFQTLQFLLLYWTYPTVVDIQKSSPTYLEIPSITICNPIGYNYTAMCMEFGVSACIGQRLIRFAQSYLCLQHMSASSYSFKNDAFQAITFNKFLKALGNLSFDLHDKLREELESYTECSIEYAGIKTHCK